MRDRRDASVVTDDLGQGGGGQSSFLSPGEDAGLLMPQPENFKQDEMKSCHQSRAFTFGIKPQISGYWDNTYIS